ncbi:MAG: hypothetical protein AAFY56_21995, partial [Pseudomonadota bacterium]
ALIIDDRFEPIVSEPDRLLNVRFDDLGRAEQYELRRGTLLRAAEKQPYSMHQEKRNEALLQS